MNLKSFGVPAMMVALVSGIELIAFATPIMIGRFFDLHIILSDVSMFIILVVAPIVEEMGRSWTFKKDKSLSATYIYSGILAIIEIAIFTQSSIDLSIALLLKMLLHISFNEVWRVKGLKWSIAYHAINNSMFGFISLLLDEFLMLTFNQTLILILSIQGIMTLSVLFLTIKRKGLMQ